MFTTETPVGSFASESILAARALARYGIDFCCGGETTLAAACTAKGVDPQEVLDSVQQALDAREPSETPWAQRPQSELIDHLLTAYHEPLREDLARLSTLLAKVVRVHGTKDPARFGSLQAAFSALRADLEPHMQKEEQVLFPMILSGSGAHAGAPIAVMRHEHEEAGGLLRQIRELTENYVAPAEACASWTALWVGLGTLESDVHEHIHLENNVLFPSCGAAAPVA